MVDRCGPSVWALARRGFLCTDAIALGAERGPLRVLGTHPDEAARETEHVLAKSMTPNARAQLGSWAQIERAVLEQARYDLFRAAERAGRLVSVHDADARKQVPPEVEDLDARLSAGGELSEDLIVGLPLGDSERRRHEAGRTATAAFLEQLDPRSRALVQLRFVEGQSVEAVASTFDCGRAAVIAHEGRLRRQLRHGLRVALSDPRVQDAEVDAFLAGREAELEPPTPTWERIRRGVLTRTFREEPPSFSRRLAWGLGAAGLGLAGWLAMVGGLLPSPADDVRLGPKARLACQPACLPGAEATARVRGGRGSTRFAIFLDVGELDPQPLLTAPDGGTLRLPLGARVRELAVPHRLRLPADLPDDAKIIAVFSESRLSAGRALDAARGVAASGVETATAALR